MPNKFSGNPMHRKVRVVNPKTKPPAKPSGGKKKVGGIGFNPKVMAKTITDLGYAASIAEAERAIAQNQAQEAEALKDLQGWANQIEEQRATGAAQAAAAWEQGIQQAQQGQAGINQLFGGAGGAEGAAYGQAGIDMLSALGASDKAFDARMAPILGAQALDYRRRASGDFGEQRKELQGGLQDLQREKGSAYSKNLLDLMDMAWGRKQDILQYQTAQQALKQANALQDYELASAQQGLIRGGQQIQSGNLDLKAQKLAIKKSTIELQKIANNPSGVDWNDPATRSNIGNAALSGSTYGSNHPKANVFQISPKVALQNAMAALKQMGLANDPRAVEAVKTAFAQTLRLSHARKMWTKWRINKQGQLIFNPAGQAPPVIGKRPNTIRGGN